MMHTRIGMRITAVLLSAALCLSMLPARALAAVADAGLWVEAETQTPIAVLGGGMESEQGKKLTLSAIPGQHIARDYDQTLYVRVTNHSAVMQRYCLTCENEYEDLSMNFVMAGAAESPLVIQPGETQTVELSVFAQNAAGTSYTVPIQSTLVTTDTPTTDAAVQLSFTCDPASGQVSIAPEGEADPETLTQTYRITNVGAADIADLSLILESEDASYLRLDPLVENYPLAAGQSIAVQLIPDLAGMKADNRTELSGSIVPAGGVAETQTRAGTSFVIRAEPSEIHTISAADLTLYQNGNPFYNSEYQWDKLELTSTVGDTMTDLAELARVYYEPGDPAKDGVNTAEELQSVLDKLIAEDGTYNIAAHTVLQYTDAQGVSRDVAINIESATTMLAPEEVPESTEPVFTYYYDGDTDTLRVEMIAYNTDVASYQAQIAAGIAAAEEKIGVVTLSAAQRTGAARLSVGAVAEESAVEYSNAGLDLLEDLVNESSRLDFSGIPPKEYEAAMKQIGHLAEATAPARTMAKALDAAAAITELGVDLGKTAAVWDDPNIPAADKLGYTAAMTVKHTFSNAINASIISTALSLGWALLDGVGLVAGAALGAVVAGTINALAEEDLELYEQLFAQMRFQTLGQQCTNRGYVKSAFSMPTYSSGDSAALSACLEVPRIHVSSRMYDGQPYYQYYADEEFGGDEYAHHREVNTEYTLNGVPVGTQEEHGLSEVAFTELKGQTVADALKSGTNTLVRDYDTNAGHYLVETDTIITVEPGADFVLGYVGSPAELPDMRQLPDFAVYPENICPEQGFILNTESDIGVTVSNLGSAGGWVTVTAQCNGETIGTAGNIYVAPFSSEKILFTCTPTEEENTITVTLARPESAIDGFSLSTEEISTSNNEAAAVLHARERMVPRIAGMPELVRFQEIPRYVVELEDALDVSSVTVRINGTDYPASLQLVTGEYGESLLRAVASLENLSAGTYQAAVTVSYYAAQDGQTVTKQMTQSAQVILQKDVTIRFYVDCPSTCIEKCVVLQVNDGGKLERMPASEISYAMSTDPCRFTVSYGLRTPDELAGCYFVVQYSKNINTGEPGGIAVAPLSDLDGRTLPTAGEAVTEASIQTSGVNKLNLSSLTAINGIPLVSLSSGVAPEVAAYDGKIYFSGADSIQARASVNPWGNNWCTTWITLSKENPNVDVKDFYTEVPLPIDTAKLSISRFREGAHARLKDGDGDVRVINATVRGSAYTAYVYLPVSLAAYSGARASIFYIGVGWVAYFDVDLLEKEKMTLDACKSITFQLPGGGTPLDCQMTVTRRDIGQPQTAEVGKVYLAPGVYDVALTYRAESDGPLRTYTQQMDVTDTQPTTITLPDSNADAAQLAAAGVDIKVAWPVLFSAAVLYARTEVGWGEALALENGGSAALPQETAQVRLELTGPGCTAEITGGVPESGVLTVGDRFTGAAVARSQTCMAGGDLTLRFSDLSDGGVQLTAYEADTQAAAFTGTVTLRGAGETYELPVTVSDLAEELHVTLPQDMETGTYDCVISLVTEQEVELPEEPDGTQLWYREVSYRDGIWTEKGEGLSGPEVSVPVGSEKFLVFYCGSEEAPRPLGDAEVTGKVSGIVTLTKEDGKTEAGCRVWRIEGVSCGATELIATVGSKTCSMPVTVTLPDQGFSTSTVLTEDSCLRGNVFVYTPERRSFYYVISDPGMMVTGGEAYWTPSDAGGTAGQAAACVKTEAGPNGTLCITVDGEQLPQRDTELRFKLYLRGADGEETVLEERVIVRWDAVAAVPEEIRQLLAVQGNTAYAAAYDTDGTMLQVKRIAGNTVILDQISEGCFYVFYCLDSRLVPLTEYVRHVI